MLTRKHLQYEENSLKKKASPIYALEILAEFDQTEMLKNEYPTIYLNLLVRLV
jgi:hypothetical protein